MSAALLAARRHGARQTTWKRTAGAFTGIAAFGAALLITGCAAPGFDLQGHRGARGLAPENTLAAFTRALETGVTTLELDIGVTRDGVVVVHHDERLNPNIARNPSGAWVVAPTPLIRELTWQEVSAYNVGRIRPGTDYDKLFPDQTARDGEPIPRLADLFEMIKKRGDTTVRFSIETKLTPGKPDNTIGPEAMVAALLGVIAAHGAESRVTIQSFDWRTLKLVQARAPRIPTVYLSAQRPNFNTIDVKGLWTAGLLRENFASIPAMVQAAGGAVWSPHFEELTRELIADAHARSLKVIAWTVNKREDIGRMIEMGVDGLITDRPDLGQAVLKERGRAAR